MGSEPSEDEAARFREAIEAGLRDVAAGRTISHTEMEERMREWRRQREQGEPEQREPEQ